MTRRVWLVGGVLLGLAGCLVVVSAVLSGRAGLHAAANVAQLVSAILAVPAVAVPLLLSWRQATRPVVATPEAVAAAKTVLAGLVSQQWRTEAVLRSLDDPDPIPVRWRVTEDDRLVDHPANLTPGSLLLTASSDDITALAGEFRGMRRRRLVIVGGPGSGKTTLAVQLLRELLSTRNGHEDDPVPVLLSVAGWETSVFPRLQDWLASRLAQDYPALRATVLGADTPRMLVESGQILPVLDGMDELPAAAQAAVITALNRSLGGTDQLVMTSRISDYRRAVDDAGDVLTSAVVIEPDPLDPVAVADHLRRCLPRRPGPVWDQVLAQLRTDPAAVGPAAALAEITATPLGVWLLRTVYVASKADPAALLDPRRFPDTATLRAHLFDRLVGALIDTRPPSSDPAELFRPHRRHDPARVRRWLGYLAHILTHPRAADGSPRTRDLAWWRLAHTTQATSRTTRVAIGLTVAVTIVLISVILGGLARVTIGLTDLAYMSAFGLAAGLVVAVTMGSWPGQRPGFADLRLRGRWPRSTSRLVPGLARGLVLGLAAAIAVGLAVSLQDGLPAGLLAGPTTGLGVSLAYGLASGLTALAEAPTPAGRANTPLASWRADRALNLIRATTIGLISGLAGGLATGFAAALAATTTFGIMVGFNQGLTLGLAAGLAAGRHHAWMAYVIATGRLTLARRLPRDLMSILDDAHRLGLLRAVGPIYQFRHAELQDRLATTYHDTPNPSQIPM